MNSCICPGCVAQDYLYRFEQCPGLCVRVVGTTGLHYKIILVIPTPGITNAPGVHHCVLILFFWKNKNRKGKEKCIIYLFHSGPDAFRSCALVSLISSASFDFFICTFPHPHISFFPTGIRAANSCQTDALIQWASRLSPRPRLILSINNPADSSLFFSNKEMDYTARLKANKLPRCVSLSLTATGPLMSEWDAFVTVGHANATLYLIHYTHRSAFIALVCLAVSP